MWIFSVVSMMKDSCSPLFVSCKRGHMDTVDYLISVCGADVEQRGVYEVSDDRSTHCVTPLWCAAVSGRLPVVKCLVKHGADINAVSDSGKFYWTPYQTTNVWLNAIAREPIASNYQHRQTQEFSQELFNEHTKWLSWVKLRSCPVLFMGRVLTSSDDWLLHRCSVDLWIGNMETDAEQAWLIRNTWDGMFHSFRINLHNILLSSVIFLIPRIPDPHINPRDDWGLTKFPKCLIPRYTS